MYVHVCVPVRRAGLYRVGISVRASGVEHLVGVHDRHEVLGVREVDDVVGVAGEHDDALYPVPAYLVLEDLVSALPPHLYEAVAAYHDELLPLGVVPVLALGHAGPADVHADLPAARGADKLRECATRVPVRPQVEDGLLPRQIAQVGAQEPLRETVRRHLWHHERPGDVPEPLQQPHYLPERGPVRHGAPAVTPGRVRADIQAVELAPVLLPPERENHLVDEVVYVEHLQLNRRVVYRDREAVGHVAAEGRYRAVVVRAAPFPVKVREPVYKHTHAVLPPVLQEQVLSRLLAPPVLAVAEPPRQRRLRAARQHHGSPVPVSLQGVEEDGGEPEVPPHELIRVLRPVDPGEVEHEVALPAPLVKLHGRGVQVVLVHRVYPQVPVPPGLAVHYVPELGAEVPADEPLRPRYQYLHCTVTVKALISRCSLCRPARSGYIPARLSSPSSPPGQACGCCPS